MRGNVNSPLNPPFPPTCLNPVRAREKRVRLKHMPDSSPLARTLDVAVPSTMLMIIRND
jgi:hypothetical protein